jgi:hypothetical protein
MSRDLSTIDIKWILLAPTAFEPVGIAHPILY